MEPWSDSRRATAARRCKLTAVEAVKKDKSVALVTDAAEKPGQRGMGTAH